MARSARASVIKRNSSNLRRRVFAPADQARTERLSAKLVALAQKPKPEKLLEEMDIETPKGDEAAAAEVEQNAMDVDGMSSKAKSKKSGSKKVARVQKRRRGKAASTISFPGLRRGRSSTGSKKSKK